MSISAIAEIAHQVDDLARIGDLLSKERAELIASGEFFQRGRSHRQQRCDQLDVEYRHDHAETIG